MLLTTTELYLRHRNIERQQRRDGAVGRVSADALRGANFRISKRYRCLADPQGQVQGRMGFKYEADDLVEGTRVSMHARNTRCAVVAKFTAFNAHTYLLVITAFHWTFDSGQVEMSCFPP